jgi:hypothetical protein
MTKNLLAAGSLAAALTLGLAGCGDDGADTRSESASGSGSGSGSVATDHTVPQGVAQQYATLEKEIKAEGGETRSGEWRIAYIVEPAEPWFEPKGSAQTFRKPAAGETHHIEIIPFEASTGRVVPNVPIKLEVLDAAGAVVDGNDLNFYYGEFFHYANNFAVPKAGTYRLRATLGAPTFLRHGEEKDTPALKDGTTVTFDNVKLQPEQ